MNQFVAQEKRLYKVKIKSQHEKITLSGSKESKKGGKFQNNTIWKAFMATALHKQYLFA